MNLQLIKGLFTKEEALELVTSLIHVKIKFHENKLINTTDENTESISYHSTRIKELQKDLFELKSFLNQKKKTVKLDGTIIV